MSPRIYLDHNATTPVDARVLAAMLPYFSEHFGNAASLTHGLGCDAAGASEVARAEVAALINAQAKDIIFTSGATEAVNLALLGAARHLRDKGRQVVTVATEHRAGLEACEQLAAEGFAVSVLGVDAYGQLDLDQLRRALTPETILISCMHANNEIGTIADIAAIGRLAKGAGVLLHVDGAQSLGKEPIDVEAMGIDLLSLSAHKLYGPKGVGALYLRRRSPRVRLQPLMHGGGHERGLRPGTLNVPGIVGFGAACRIAAGEMAEERVRVRALKERLWQALEGVGGIQAPRPPRTLPGRHPERGVRGHQRPAPAGRDAADRRLARRRLHLGHAQALARAARHRPGLAAGRGRPAPQPGPPPHRRGGRRGGRPARRRGGAPAFLAPGRAQR